MIFHNRFKRNNRTFKWYSEPPFIWCLPIKQEILNNSQIEILYIYIFHEISPPFFIQTWLQQLYALLFPKSHVFLNGRVDVQWFQGMSSGDLSHYVELSMYITFDFLVESKNVCKLFFFSVFWKVFIFARKWLHLLCSQVFYHHSGSMIMSIFLPFTKNFVIRCL